MAGKGKSRDRVEPSFGDFHESGDDLRLDASERISGTAKQPARKPKATTGRAKSQKKEKRSRNSSGRGATGIVRSLFYWCIVLGIWRYRRCRTCPLLWRTHAKRQQLVHSRTPAECEDRFGQWQRACQSLHDRRPGARA